MYYSKSWRQIELEKKEDTQEKHQVHMLNIAFITVLFYVIHIGMIHV